MLCYTLINNLVVHIHAGMLTCTHTGMTTVEFNGLSPAAYRNRILHSEQKILAKIQLSVIYAHMVDVHRLSHICKGKHEVHGQDGNEI